MTKLTKFGIIIQEGDKMKEKKKTKNKANPFIWAFYTFCSKVFLWFKHHIKYNRKVFKKRNKKQGCLVIYNHASNKDHFFSTASFNYTRVNYVITKHFYFNKTLRKVLTLVHAIPRDQFKSDLLSIKNIKKAVETKSVVAIAPAGQITVHGEMPYIDPAIVKLVKLCKVDVYALRIYGGYLAYPKWHKVKRNFPIKLEFVKVLNKEDLEELNDNEIYQKIINSINVCDRVLQKEHPHKIKGKALIEGLEKIIYYCPKCKSYHTFKSSGNIMTCQNCGNSIRMNKYGFLEPGTNDSIIFENESLWYNYEKELIKRQIIDGTFKIEATFKLKRNIKEEYLLEEVGEGTLVLTKDSFYYDGTINNEVVHKEFALNSLIQLPFDVGTRIDIPDSEGTFEFRSLHDDATVIQYVQAIDVMRELRLSKE